MISPKITTILLDIGGVLIHLNVKPLLDELSRATGLSPTELLEDRNNSAYYAFERGEITFTEYHDQVSRRSAGDDLLPMERFRELWMGVMGAPTPLAGLLPALRRQAKVFLLTNTNELHFPRLYSNYDFMEQVDGVIASHLVGCRKPEREIYELALQTAGAQPEQTLFIDDAPRNIAAARDIGLAAHRFTGMEELHAFFRENGFRLPE